MPRQISCLSSLLFLLVLSGAIPLAAETLTHPQILTVDGCGKPLPVRLGNPDGFKQFNVDLDAYKKNEAARMVKVLSSVCQALPKDRQIVDDKIDSVRLINAQGAEDPTPYIGGRVLLIEFVGGKFGEATFRAALIRALEKGSVTHSGFDCAKATRNVEQVICAEPDLANDDRDLSEIYRQALKSAASNPAQRRRLVQAQRDWLAQRDSHCISGTPPSDEKGSETTIACLKSQYENRMEALTNPSPESAPQAASAATYFDPISKGSLTFDSHADGTAQFEISNGNARGVCDLGSDAATPAHKTASNAYEWADTASNCKVTLTPAGDRIQVSYEGDCFSVYCGVHATDFQGEYRKKK